MRTKRAAIVGVVAAMLLAAGAVPAGAGEKITVAEPTVTGPVTGGKGVPTIIGTNFDPAQVGYVLEEYFLEGEATSYDQAKPFGPDGKWRITKASTAPYKTRVVVYRPEQEADFDGTVFVEWLNVSAGFDSSPDWGSAHRQMIRAGAAWVGVSAQSVGIQGGTEAVGGVAAGGVKASDPERYGTLSHPGDEYSYDIFSQAGLAALGDAKGDSVIGPLKAERVIAAGESQSAFRMVTYVNAVHPATHVYDGYVIHSRSAAGAGLGKSLGRGIDDPSMPETAATRSDIDVPVLTFQTETDLTRLGYLPARQKDGKNYRLWEVAGTAHADAYTAKVGFSDLGDGASERELLDPTKVTGGPLSCTSSINSGPAFAVLNAAFFHIERWVRDGKAPPRAPRIKATSDPEPAISRDEHGIAEGGIRTPLVDVPIATLDGEANAGGSFCSLFGNTKPFDAATLSTLYPNQDAYAKQFKAAADKAVKAGFMLRDEADNFVNASEQLNLGLA